MQQQYEEQLDRLRADTAQQLADAKRTHQEELHRQGTLHRRELKKMQSQHELVIKQMQAGHEGQIRDLKEQLRLAPISAQKKLEQQTKQVRKDLETKMGDMELQIADRERTIAQLKERYVATGRIHTNKV
jgi:hypothetical protein